MHPPPGRLVAITATTAPMRWAEVYTVHTRKGEIGAIANVRGRDSDLQRQTDGTRICATNPAMLRRIWRTVGEHEG